MAVDRPRAATNIPPELFLHAHQQWTRSCLKVCVSQLHTDVAEHMRALNLASAMEIESLTADRLFSIDIAIPGKLNIRESQE